MYSWTIRNFIVAMWLAALTAMTGAKPATAEEGGGVVAIGGSVTEIVYALGEQDQLIARDSTSTYPEAAAELPDVGYMRALSPEGVLSINPKKIVAIEGSGPPEALEVLQKSSVPVITIPNEYSRQGIVDKILAVGDALGVPNKARALAEDVEADVAEAERKANGHNAPPRVLFVLSLAGDRIFGAGAGTSASSIIEMAGGINAVSEVEGFKQLSDEAVITAAPDIILAMVRAGNHAVTDERIMANPALASTPAGQNGKLITMGGLYLLGFGPRTASAINDLSTAIDNQGH